MPSVAGTAIFIVFGTAALLTMFFAYIHEMLLAAKELKEHLLREEINHLLGKDPRHKRSARMHLLFARISWTIFCVLVSGLALCGMNIYKLAEIGGNEILSAFLAAAIFALAGFFWTPFLIGISHATDPQVRATKS